MIQELRREFEPSRLVFSLVSGSVIGIIVITVMISFATLIFSGDVSGYLSTGIGIALVSAIVLSAITSVTSSFPASISVPQDSPAALMAVITSGLALHAFASPEVKFLTIVAIMALTSLLTGAVFLILGSLDLGNFVRYLPYPVVGGFLAGTGWLLLRGAFGVLMGQSLTLAILPDLFQASLLFKWLPGLVFAVLMLFILRRYSHFLLMPGLLVGATGLFYAVVLITGTSLEHASSLGWFIGPFPEESLWEFLTIPAFTQANWPFILSQLANIAIIVLVSTVALLLNVSGAEVSIRQDIDLNHELRVAGIGNLVSGLGGGMTGYPTMSLSVLGHTLKGGRLSGLIVAGLCGLALLLGTSVLAYFPRMIAGGLLLFLALSFLIEWVYDAWFRLPRIDYAVVILILVVVGTVGYLEGVAVGVVASVFLFVLNFRRVDIVKHELSGSETSSNVQRPRIYQNLLQRQGHQIYILQLQSYIFFGTANRLLERVSQRMSESDPPRCVLLDFSMVTGLDTSATYSFAKMKNQAQIHDVTLLFADLAPEIRHQLQQEVFGDEEEAVWHIFPDRDHALEWWEDQLIDSLEEVGVSAPPKTVIELFEETLPETIPVATLMKYLEKREIPQGHVLIHEGRPPEAIYFIESGQVTAQLDQPDGDVIRLSTLGSGTVVGEVGIYLEDAATATVIADDPCIIYSLSADALNQMEAQDSELAAIFHRFMARLLAERLARQTRALEALLQ